MEPADRSSLTTLVDSWGRMDTGGPLVQCVRMGIAEVIAGLAVTRWPLRLPRQAAWAGSGARESWRASASGSGPVWALSQFLMSEIRQAAFRAPMVTDHGPWLRPVR